MTELATAPATRHARKTRSGLVVSDRMTKTIVVRVERLIQHPLYRRTVRRRRRVKAHDEENRAKVGDWVTIAETRPLSKDKRWRLVKILRRAHGAPSIPQDPQGGGTP